MSHYRKQHRKPRKNTPAASPGVESLFEKANIISKPSTLDQINHSTAIARTLDTDRVIHDLKFVGLTRTFWWDV